VLGLATGGLAVVIIGLAFLAMPRFNTCWGRVKRTGLAAIEACLGGGVGRQDGTGL